MVGSLNVSIHWYEIRLTKLLLGRKALLPVCFGPDYLHSYQGFQRGSLKQVLVQYSSVAFWRVVRVGTLVLLAWLASLARSFQFYSEGGDPFRGLNSQLNRLLLDRSSDTLRSPCPSLHVFVIRLVGEKRQGSIEFLNMSKRGVTTTRDGGAVYILCSTHFWTLFGHRVLKAAPFVVLVCVLLISEFLIGDSECGSP